MAFESIPGVGEKTADALAALDDPETALQQGDVLTLMDAPIFRLDAWESRPTGHQ